jgi:hypothetical protein
MKHFLLFLFCLPAFSGSLDYAINWPSGLSLGQVTLDSAKSNGNWNLSLTIDASVPGYAVRDEYKSIATPDLCSVEFDKTFAHGQHKNQETLNFNQQDHTVTRETSGGGKSDISVGSCARDPLAFIQFLRQQLAAGTLPPQQPVVYGAAYDVRVEYSGAQTIQLGEQKVEADRIVARIKGPASDLNVEIFFSRDAARTPLLARIPVPLGTFSVELQK